MIIDTLENLNKYATLNPYFATVVQFLQQYDLSSLPLGRREIDGEDVFVNVGAVQGKSKEEARVETHDRMVDIQIPLSCSETMGYTPRGRLPVAKYDVEKDISFYEGRAEKYIVVNPGEFVIFFPQDGHAPCISESEEIVKAIFKIKA